MKESLLLLVMFSVGVLAGFLYPDFFQGGNDLSTSILFILMFSVGFNLGGSQQFVEILRNMSFRIVEIPLITIIGTFFGMLVLSLFPVGFSLKELLAVGSGFGYYSLSSMIISRISGEMLAVVALLSNIMREIISIVLTPLLVKYFGGTFPIVSAGATSMDTALPVIIKYAGSDHIFTAVFNGIVLTLLVPFLVVVFLNL